MLDNVFARRAWAEPETCMREGVALTTAWPRTVAACMWTSASWHDLLECGGLHGTCQCSATAVEDVPWPPKAESRQNAQTAHVQRLQRVHRSSFRLRPVEDFLRPTMPTQMLGLDLLPLDRTAVRIDMVALSRIGNEDDVRKSGIQVAHKQRHCRSVLTMRRG